MDQTSFSLGVELMVGAPAGGFALHYLTGWSFWVSYPLGGIIGFFTLAIGTFLFIEGVGRFLDRFRRKQH